MINRRTKSVIPKMNQHNTGALGLMKLNVNRLMVTKINAAIEMLLNPSL